MAQPVKASLVRLDKTNRTSPKPVGDPLTVHFNPTTLSISYRSTASGTGRVAGAPGGNEANPVHVTSTSSTLSMELLFDTTKTGKDVRITTYRLVNEMLSPPKPSTNQNEDAPWVRFQWGSFFYYGFISSLDETLDLFSAEGKPLRSSVRLTMTEVLPPVPQPSGSGSSGGGGGASAGFSASLGVTAGGSISASASAGLSLGASVGTMPLTLTQSGDTLQSLAARAGAGDSWQAIAAANNIDNPRLLQAGAVVDLNARADASIG
jgi:hypothetical protein